MSTTSGCGSSGSNRHALILNLHGEGAGELETNMSMTFQDIDDWGDDAAHDPGHELRVHAAHAAADDVRLTARVLSGIGFDVSVPPVCSDLEELKRTIFKARDAMRPRPGASPVPSVQRRSTVGSPIPQALNLPTIPSGSSSPTPDDTDTDMTTTDGTVVPPLLVVLVVGSVFGFNPDSTTDDVDTSRLALPPEPGRHSSPPASVLQSQIVEWIRAPSINDASGPFNVSTLALFDISTTVQSAFRAHVGDESTTSHPQPLSGAVNAGAGTVAPPCQHFGITGYHFVMYSSGQTLVSLALHSFAGVRGTNCLTVGQLQRDIDRRASRCNHFAGPTFDGPRGSPIIVAGGATLATIAALPSSQPSPYDRFDVTLTLKDRELETYRVMDTLLDAANDFGAQPTMRVHGVEWGVSVTLESEGASEDVLRRNVFQHLARVWELPEARIAQLTTLSPIDSANECLVFIRHEQHRLGRALLKQLVMSSDPCLGRFAVFKATVAVEIRLRASVQGLLLVMSRARGAQFTCALGVQTWSASLDWAPVVDPEDMSRPQSANTVGGSLTRLGSSTMGGGGGSHRNSVNGPAWGQQGNFLPGLVSSAGDAATTTGTSPPHTVPGGDGTDAASPVDPVAALRQQAAKAASAALLQRVGRGLAVRSERLWTSIGVPRDPYLYTLALAAAEWDALADVGTLPGPWSASLDLFGLVRVSVGCADVAGMIVLGIAAGLADAAWAVAALHVLHALVDEASTVPRAASGRSLPTALLRFFSVGVVKSIIASILGACRSRVAFGAIDLTERLIVHPAASLSQRRCRGCLSVAALEQGITATVGAVSGVLGSAIAVLRGVLVVAAVLACTHFSDPAVDPLLLAMIVAGSLVCACAVGVAGDASVLVGLFWAGVLVAAVSSADSELSIAACAWAGLVAAFASSGAGAEAAMTAAATATAAPALHLARRLLESPVLAGGVPTAPRTFVVMGDPAVSPHHGGPSTGNQVSARPPPWASQRHALKAVAGWLLGCTVAVALVAAFVAVGNVGFTCPDLLVTCAYVRNGTSSVHESQHRRILRSSTSLLSGCEPVPTVEEVRQACPTIDGWSTALVGGPRWGGVRSSGMLPDVEVSDDELGSTNATSDAATWTMLV